MLHVHYFHLVYFFCIIMVMTTRHSASLLYTARISVEVTHAIEENMCVEVLVTFPSKAFFLQEQDAGFDSSYDLIQEAVNRCMTGWTIDDVPESC